MARLLEQGGARAFTQEAANRLTDQALQALSSAQPKGPAGEALRALADKLLSRQG